MALRKPKVIVSSSAIGASSVTAKHLIELITTGAASVTSCYELSDLVAAKNQVLYEFEL